MEKVLIHDICYYQGDLSRYWQLFKDKGCKVIIIQSSNGLAFQNYFIDTVKIAKNLGFLVGSYHYFRQHILDPEGSLIPCNPIKQAEIYYNWVQKSGVKMDMPPALDVENGGNPQGVGFAAVTSCLTHIENLFGRTPMIYSSSAILGGLARPGWERYPLWLAHYTTEDKISIPKPWTKWTIWQFSDRVTYTPPGTILKKPIDHNWFNGSLDDLRKFAGISESTTPPSPTGKADIADLKNRVNKAIDDWAKAISSASTAKASITDLKNRINKAVDEWAATSKSLGNSGKISLKEAVLKILKPILKI
jgi:GH25 family lysozyme M1 (1,4-beta-N-acetylmuramidase)